MNSINQPATRRPASRRLIGLKSGLYRQTMETREVAGAIERPANSRIEIEPSADGTWIRIPRPQLPWPVYVGAVVAVASLIAVLVAGGMVFVFHRPFPGYAAVVGGRLTPQPLTWRLAGLLGWLLMIPALVGLVAATMRPLLRTESIFIPGRQNGAGAATLRLVLLQSRGIFGLHENGVPVYDILRFDLHRDPQELVESEIVVETRSALEKGRTARRFTVAASVSEAEREWLSSALNALLTRAQ